MYNNKVTLAIALALGLGLTGCGGSGGANSTDTATTPPPPQQGRTLVVTGKAIDGYIVGGTVFLDINGNGKAEPNEPQKVTQEGGDYSLEVPEEDAHCLAYSAIIVDVPAGAYDEGSEEEGVEPHEVTEPYQITLQPTFEPITEEDFTNGLVRNISPLTTVVWEAIERNYPRAKEEKHCNYLKKHDEAVTALKNEIEATVAGLVYFYNLSADQMYADFIANSDSEAFHVAQDIMKGLKAAYKHKTKLSKQYPEAENVDVFVYRSPQEDAFHNIDKGWYRSERLSLVNEDRIENTKLKDTTNLNVVDFVISKFHELGQEWNDQTKNGWFSDRKDAYRNEEGQYLCAKIERVSFDVEGIHYELGNASDDEILADSFEACNYDDFTTPDERNFHLRYQQNDIGYSADFYFRQQQSRFGDLANWKAFAAETELDP